MNCKNCGAYNENGSRFCANCGANLDSIEPAPTVRNEQNTIQNETNVEPLVDKVQSNTIAPVENKLVDPISNGSHVTEPLPNNSSKKSLKKEYIILGAIGVLVIILGMFLVLKFLNKNNDLVVDGVDTKEIFDTERPIIVKKGEKYGYITSKGKTLVEPIYDKVTEFYKGYAVITSENTDDYLNEYKIIDENGNAVKTIQGSLEPLYIQEGDVWLIDRKLFDKNFKQLTSDDNYISYLNSGYFEFADYTNNKSGIMNAKGEAIYTSSGTGVIFDVSVNPYDNTDAFAIVDDYSNQKEYIISLKTKKTLYTINGEEASISNEDDGFFSVYNRETYEDIAYIYCVNGDIGYMVEGNDVELELYDYKNLIVEIDYSYDYDEKGLTSRYQYYDIKNKKMLESRPKFPKDEDKLEEEKYGYEIFTNAGKQGLKDGDDIVVPCEYEKIKFLEIELHTYLKNIYKKEYVMLVKDGKTSLYDIKNKETLKTFDGSNVITGYNSSFVYRPIYGDDKYKATSYEFYNLITNKSLTIEADSMKVYSNYITVSNEDEKTTYYNTNLEKIYEAEKD